MATMQKIMLTMSKLIRILKRICRIKPHIKYSQKTQRHTDTHAHIQNKAQQA